MTGGDAGGPVAARGHHITMVHPLRNQHHRAHRSTMAPAHAGTAARPQLRRPICSLAPFKTTMGPDHAAVFLRSITGNGAIWEIYRRYSCVLRYQRHDAIADSSAEQRATQLTVRRLQPRMRIRTRRPAGLLVSGLKGAQDHAAQHQGRGGAARRGAEGQLAMGLMGSVSVVR